MKTISNPNLIVTVAPELGGVITGFRVTRSGASREIVQTPGNPPDLTKRGMFGMLPWVGRIPDAMIDCSAIPALMEKIRIEHQADAKTCLHGIYRQQQCQVIEESEGRIHLQYVHDQAIMSGYSWFGPFQVDSVLRLSEDWTLESTYRLTNTGPQPFPAVIGEHPMFPRVDGMRFQFNAKQILRMNPITLVPDGEPEPIPGELDFSSLRTAPDDLEVLYLGWDGHATVSYEDYDVFIRDQSQVRESGRCLMAWHRRSNSLCALESQTGEANGANRLNAGKWSGTQILGPGESIEIQNAYTIAPRW